MFLWLGSGWAAGTADGERAASPWWAAWEDPGLASWIRGGLAAHPSLDAAQATVRAARAARELAASQRRPRAEAMGTARVGRERTMASDFRAMEMAPWEVGASFSWELDIFRRQAERVADARASEKAAEADRAAIELMLGTEIATAYLALAGLADEILAVEEMRRRAVAIADRQARRAAAGRLRSSEASAAAAEVRRMTQERVDLEREREEWLARAAELLGVFPSNSPTTLASLSLPEEPRDDSAWALRRPDVLRAHARLEAARATATAERRNRLPTVEWLAAVSRELGRSEGTESEWAAWTGPRVVLPLIAPALTPAREWSVAELDRAEADVRAMLRQAVREIAATVSARRWAREALSAAEGRARKLSAVAETAAKRAAAGVASPTEADEAALAAAQARREHIRALAGAHAAHLNWVRAVGGG